MLKEFSLVSYRIAVQKLVKTFKKIQFEHTPQAHNQHTDALATVASKIDVAMRDIYVSINHRILRTTAAELIPAAITDEQDWSILVMKKLV